MLSKEAALYVPSGTQSNLVALMSHCQRGEEYIVGQDAHTYKYEGGGAAVLGSIQPQPLPVEADGSLDLDRVEAAIKPDDFHFAITRLLCLENTISGRVLPLTYMEQAAALANRRGLAIHLDGARVFNAAIKLGVEVSAISQYFDSVSVCLSKGLGAPVGSVLCGTAELIKTARRWRKMLGGGMRQAGIIAAGGIHALENNISRLQTDHDNAALLGRELAKLPALQVELEYLHTNMVFFTPQDSNGTALAEYLKEQGILVDAAKNIRLVTHMQISRDDVLTVVDAVREFYARG
ncbi:MAG: low-specificity L-threonine aldolase, partial [Pseudohongiellaceae bacterium]